jgi:HAE1 family hydrophobic/amphiphilic exporter-1
MSKFFINRPIVAIVISLLTVIVGLVVIASLPIAQFRRSRRPRFR